MSLLTRHGRGSPAGQTRHRPRVASTSGTPVPAARRSSLRRGLALGLLLLASPGVCRIHVLVSQMLGIRSRSIAWRLPELAVFASLAAAAAAAAVAVVMVYVT